MSASAPATAADEVAARIAAGESAAAAEVVSTLARHTPVLSSHSLSERCGGRVLLKAENLQRTGSFKLRGAVHKISHLAN
ncbi:MAG: pyridoxal-phosphate dependent enzyme, partial [Solirubrobacteraceae bacterium]